MQTYVRLEATVRAGHAEGIARVRQGVRDGGAYITDFSLFSNKAVRLSFALERASLAKLRASLASAGVALDAETAAQLDRVCAQSGPADEEVLGSLYAVLVHDEPDLEREVPPIPG